jgi:hypothetical protein
VDPRWISTVGLILDIGGAVLLAIDILDRGGAARRHAFLDQLHAATVKGRAARERKDSLLSQGWSHSRPSLFLPMAESDIRDADWEAERIGQDVREDDKAHDRLARRWATWGLVALVFGFLCQIVAAWLPAPR